MVEALILFRAGYKTGYRYRSVRLSLSGHDCLTQLAVTVRAMRGVFSVELYDPSSYERAMSVHNSVDAKPVPAACKPQKGALYL